MNTYERRKLLGSMIYFHIHQLIEQWKGTNPDFKMEDYLDCIDGARQKIFDEMYDKDQEKKGRKKASSD